MPPALLIHVGLAKGGSTTLQAFFERHPGIHLVDPRPARRLIALPSALEYDAAAARAALDGPVAEAAARGLAPVLSHERLGGNPHAGHHDAVEIARRLAALRPDARLLLCIREQMAMIASCYKQYVRVGGVMTLEQYLAPAPDRRVPRFDPVFYEYDRIIRAYHAVAGRDRVHVATLEELEGDPATFLRRLCDLVGVEMTDDPDGAVVHNPGLADDEVEARRVRNLSDPPRDRLSLRDPCLFDDDALGRLLPDETAAFRAAVRDAVPRAATTGRSIVDEVRRRLGARYADANRRAQELTGLDLARLGYETASPVTS
jgi:hypothetical protein